MRALKRLAVLASIAAGACGVPDPPESTGGIGDGGAAGDCPRGVVVHASDYQSTNVALMSLAGEVLSPSFISSASAGTALSAPLSGDVLPPSMPVASDEVVLIDSYPASVLSWVSVASGNVRAQLSVGTGFASNPHDYVHASTHKAYVPRFEPNPQPGREPFDSGNDVLVVDPSVPEITGSIDMTPAMAGESERFLPRADKAILVGTRLFVLLAGHSKDFLESAPSRIVQVDTETEAITDVLVLDGLHGCAGMAKSPDGTRLAVSCSGQFAGDSVPTLDDSGVALVSVDGVLREEQRFRAAELGDDPIGFAIAWPDDEHLLLTTFGRFANGELPARDDTLVRLGIASGESEVLLRSNGTPFTLGELRCACDACFASDAGRNVVHRYAVSAGELREHEAIVVETKIGLPPRYLGLF